MELLPINKDCAMTEGLRALVVLYTVVEEKHVIRSDLREDICADLVMFLDKTRAKDKSSDIRILWCKDGEYDLICAAGISEEDDHAVRKAGALAYKSLKKLGTASIVLSSDLKIRALAEGALLASFSYDYLKEDRKPRATIRPEKDDPEFSKAFAVASAQNFCRFLAETPANLMTPRIFVEYVKGHFRKSRNVEILVFDRRWVEDNKMGLFLSVANGSDEELQFLHIKYRGREEDGLDVALVGKGITFDSGGISLKSSLGMGDMKMDMMGAASVVSVLGLVSGLGIKLNVDAFVPLCENLPSGRATKPGDVARASNGKTVEIDNTDAEGRLVLADALVYAQKHNPKYVVDVATLTGAIAVALGSVYSGFFSNDDTLASWIAESGDATGDLVWRMPLDSRYRLQLDSRVADMKNAGTRYGGSCVAAIFLKEFIGKGIKWAHIDIAGVMHDSHFSELYGKGSSGLSVRMLASLIEKIESEK